ncbi:putative reverse transcriptase domain-containing protein [Tanacetum coccineum]
MSPVFLVHVTTNEVEHKSEKKRLKDVLIVRDFTEVFLEDLPGLPPTRQVEFQSSFTHGPQPGSSAPLSIRTSEMKECTEQLKELSDKAVIRPSSRPGSADLVCQENRWNSSGFALGYPRVEYLLEDRPKVRSCWVLPEFMKVVSKDRQTMTKLTQKKIQFVWGDKQEAAFQLLKQKLCSAPILALPEGSKDFIAYCDASKKGLGAVLMQREKVIAYASRQLEGFMRGGRGE